MPFRGKGGRTVYHCHIAAHEVLGMMGTLEVTQPGETPDDR
ncbi:multicopper oxidase domain-containing protein [Streptomyces atroolivaceus]